jgi:hypothetical protein
VSGTGTEITADDLANFIKTIIDMANKQNNSYNIGEGDCSIGVVGASPVGTTAYLTITAVRCWTARFPDVFLRLVRRALVGVKRWRRKRSLRERLQGDRGE